VDQASSLTDEDPESISDWISGKLQPSPTFNQIMGKTDKALLNEMLDWIQSLAISDD
jgi:hypothetical protein